MTADTETRDDTQAVGQLVVRGNLDLDSIARLGMWLAAAESGSKDPNAVGAAAALRIAYASTLGLPAHAGSEIHLIQGNLTLSAKLCRALAHQHGLQVVPVEETKDSCTAAVIDTRTGRELGRRTFTLAMAKARGLSGANWTKTPERMLWARASKLVLDDFAPWVTVGVLSEEQAYEAVPVAAEPVVVDDAEVIDPDDDIPFGDA